MSWSSRQESPSRLAEKIVNILRLECAARGLTATRRPTTLLSSLPRQATLMSGISGDLFLAWRGLSQLDPFGRFAPFGLNILEEVSCSGLKKEKISVRFQESGSRPRRPEHSVEARNQPPSPVSQPHISSLRRLFRIHIMTFDSQK